MLKVFPAAFHIHGLSSSRDSLYLLCSQLCCMTFSIHWLKQRSASLLRPRYCWRCSKCQNSRMLWWLPGQRVVGVRVFHWKDTQLWYLDVQHKYTVKTLGFFEYKYDRDAWFLDLATVCSSSFTHMAFFLTTYWKSFLYLISQPHTHTKHLLPFWGVGHDSFLNFCAWWRRYPWSLFSFMKQIIVFTL